MKIPVDINKIRLITLTVAFPVKEAYSNKNYSLVIRDANNRFHYWDSDGTYDGWSQDTDINEN